MPPLASSLSKCRDQLSSLSVGWRRAEDEAATMWRQDGGEVDGEVDGEVLGEVVVVKSVRFRCV